MKGENMNYNQGYYMDDYTNNASYINYPQNRGFDNGYDGQETFSKHDDGEKCMCCMRTVCYYPISWEDDCRKKDDHKKPCCDQQEKDEKRPCCRCNQSWNDEKYDCKKKDDDDCYDYKNSNHCGCKKEDTDKKHCVNNSRCGRNNRCCSWFCRGFRF